MFVNGLYVFFQENPEALNKPGAIGKLYNIINTVKELDEEPKVSMIHTP